jgi:SagB-type dehydrogenase family enzyme
MTNEDRRARLLRLAETLTDEECRHLLALVEPIVDGDRFWEEDFGILYNEQIKGRYINLSRNEDQLTPPAPITDQGIFAPVPLRSVRSGNPIVKLPDPLDVTVPLGQVLRERRSRRDFTARPLSAVELSTLLRLACGITGRIEAYGYSRVMLRSFPTAGGLGSPEIYLGINGSAEGEIPPGIFYYDCEAHQLAYVRDGDYRSLIHAIALQQPWVGSASVVMFITGVYERLSWKYGDRAYRYMCMDAGFVASNVHLVCAALGLGSCAIAGFIDDMAETLLEVDGRNEMLLTLIAVGSLPEASAGQ